MRLPLLDILFAALAEGGQHAGDVLLGLAELRRVFELLGHGLCSQLEQVPPQPLQLVVQLVGFHRCDGFVLHLIHSETRDYCPCRLETKRVFTGNLCATRSSAFFANSSLTPLSSYMIVPGFTIAVQYATSPLPVPMRTSSGLADTGTCGKIRTWTRPSRCVKCEIETRPASICLALTRPGSRDCRPYSP